MVHLVPSDQSIDLSGLMMPSELKVPPAAMVPSLVRVDLHSRAARGMRGARRSVAQWLEHRSPKPGVGGSSPSTPASHRADLLIYVWCDKAGGRVRQKKITLLSIR